jgi:alpha-D-ribose 1-methylphosphonate 5-triphosphate synthase subunit PhnH
VTATAVQSVSPESAQTVFRAVLEALARPGTVHRLPGGAAGSLAARVPPALLPVLALADLSTPVCVLAGEGPGGDAWPGEFAGTGEHAGTGAHAGAGEWAEVVRAATGAPAASLPGAHLVSVLRPLAPGELARLRTGTATAPEDGALAVLAVGGLAADAPDSPDAPGVTRLRLTGPGVPGARGLRVSGLPADFTASRAALVNGFPAGADLLFVTADGAVAGLPRTTTAEVTEETA